MLLTISAVCYKQEKIWWLCLLRNSVTIIVQVIECLRKNKDHLSSKCHAAMFKREVRLSRDFVLWNVFLLRWKIIAVWWWKEYVFNESTIKGRGFHLVSMHGDIYSWPFGLYSSVMVHRLIIIILLPPHLLFCDFVIISFVSIITHLQEEEAANPNIDFMLISKCKAMIKVCSLRLYVNFSIFIYFSGENTSNLKFSLFESCLLSAQWTVNI